MEKEENKSKRSGDTTVTSVSVSREFGELIAQYDLSPTECFRRGVAVTLFDLGVAMYQSTKNKERLEYVQEFMKKLEADEKLREQFEKIESFEAIQKHLDKIKKLVEEVEDGD